ncbi:MAG: phospholipase D-like domain-containing protein [Beijerinckiaceae bacterium]|nr:phospholipase D-like domain-containing protein [Beijerinckiaceae bacterium]
MSDDILETGRNCWRIEPAGRFALIVDAEDYFRCVKDAILQARHSVYLIGWDFDPRIEFEPAGGTIEGPNRVGDFLKWIGRSRPDLGVHVLKWDLGVLPTLGPGLLAMKMLDWTTSKNIQFRLDKARPLGSVLHQKVVVIDDALAFCGGIDMTLDRWDTRAHLDNDPRRREPGGKAYEPWHDATSAVSGPAARALGDLARAAWLRATDVDLEPAPPRDALWPRGLKASLEDVMIAIARTHPDGEDEDEIREIETLYLDCIAQARRTIYFESQYFASRRIAEAMAKRLSEDDGPEIVVINPLSADGVLEAAVMDTARARLLKLVKAADRHGRFRIYTPVTAGGQPIYVHAKISIVDDRLLRVGSSNLNNRSQGYDTECDIALEAQVGADRLDGLKRNILGLRDDLLGEHLGCAPALVSEAVRREGSLVRAIDSLMGDGRSLQFYEPDEIGALEENLTENELLDPEKPPNGWRGLKALLGLTTRYRR